MAIYQVSASAQLSRDAQSYAVIDDGGATPMTLTPPPGAYVAVFSATAWGTGNSGSPGQTVDFAIYANAVQQQHSIRHLMHESSYDATCRFTIATAAIVTVSTGQAIDIRWQTSVSGQTGYITNRTLTLIPVSVYAQKTATADDTTSSSDYSVTLGSMLAEEGVDFDAGTHLAIFSASMEPPSVGSEDEIAAVRIYEGGAHVYAHSHRQNIFEASFDWADQQILAALKITPTATEDIEVRWANIGTAGTIICHERTLILVEVASGDIVEANATAAANATNTSWALMDSMDIVDPGADDWLGFFSAVFTYTAISGVPQADFAFYEGATRDADSDRRQSFSNSYSAGHRILTAGPTGSVTLGASDDLELWWQSSTSTQRTVYERVLVAIREPSEPPPGYPPGTIIHRFGFG